MKLATKIGINDANYFVDIFEIFFSKLDPALQFLQS